MDMFEENLKVLEEAMEQMCIDFTTDSSESESSSNEEEEEEEETQLPSEARQAQLLLQYQATMKLLANSQPLRRSSCGKRLRLDVPASVRFFVASGSSAHQRCGSFSFVADQRGACAGASCRAA